MAHETDSSDFERSSSPTSSKRSFCCTFPSCQKSFSRSDNLLQHIRSHVAKNYRNKKISSEKLNEILREWGYLPNSFKQRKTKGKDKKKSSRKVSKLTIDSLTSYPPSPSLSPSPSSMSSSYPSPSPSPSLSPSPSSLLLSSILPPSALSQSTFSLPLETSLHSNFQFPSQQQQQQEQSKPQPQHITFSTSTSSPSFPLINYLIPSTTSNFSSSSSSVYLPRSPTDQNYLKLFK